MKTFIIIVLIFVAIIAYVKFSRFIAFLFLDDFNMKLVKEDYYDTLDDCGFENMLFMLLWPIIIIQWAITKIMK